MREEYEKWFVEKFGHSPMPLDSRQIDFCWAGYQAGVESMNKPVNLSERQKLVDETVELRHKLDIVASLLQEAYWQEQLRKLLIKHSNPKRGLK